MWRPRREKDSHFPAGRGETAGRETARKAGRSEFVPSPSSRNSISRDDDETFSGLTRFDPSGGRSSPRSGPSRTHQKDGCTQHIIGDLRLRAADGEPLQRHKHAPATAEPAASLEGERKTEAIGCFWHGFLKFSQ
jgi:hypothetical protein